MILAMAGFSLEDMFIKQLSSTIPVGQILVVVGLFSSVFFALMAKAKGHKIFARHVWTSATITRIFAEAFAAVAFVTSLALVPISTVAAIFQVTPLVITMGAALFLGEKVGWRRWLAIFVGFIGVLLIIKPGYNSFDASVLLVLISVLGVALRDLITRIIPENVSSSIISFQAFSSLIIAGMATLFVSSEGFVPVATTELMFFACGIVFGIAGYYGIVSAMRVGDASIVSPFRYTRLLFSLIIGMVVFDESLDALSLLGSAIIIGTGLYTFIREHQLAKKQSFRPNINP